ncbi:MAG: response regulator transcription factor [Chitinophagaceae bacterium]|nr:response regulator transcription factor [Chitinophagaceae bacterium]
MTTLSCITIDDEPLGLTLLKQYIGKIPSLKLIGQFDDAVAGAEFLKKNEVDLLFIDINMPDITGIDLVRALERKPMTIFVTAFRKFAFEGFELDAIDYLLKPVDFERFEKAVRKAIEFHALRKAPQEGAQDALFVRSEYKLVRIPFGEILYIEALKDYLRIHRLNDKPVMTLMTIKALAEKLPENKFIRIHRSYIVSVNQIHSISNRKIRLPQQLELPIGDSYLEAVQALVKS